MSRGEKMLFAGGIAAALLLLWLIKQEYGRLLTSGEQLRDVNHKVAGRRWEAQQLQKTLEVLRRSTASSADPSGGRALDPATPAAPPPARPRAPSRPWLTRLFAESPNLHRLYLDAYRSDLEFAHALTFERLGLNAEERATIGAILTRDMERRTDIAATARANQLGSADPSIRAIHAQREQEREAALHSVLGGREVSWSLQSSPMMTIASDAAAQLHRTSTPLTLAQAEALEKLLRQGLSGRRVGDAYVQPTEADYAALAQEAGRMLSPAQSAVVRALIEQYDARRQLDQARAAKRK